MRLLHFLSCWGCSPNIKLSRWGGCALWFFFFSSLFSSFFDCGALCTWLFMHIHLTWIHSLLSCLFNCLDLELQQPPSTCYRPFLSHRLLSLMHTHPPMCNISLVKIFFKNRALHLVVFFEMLALDTLDLLHRCTTAQNKSNTNRSSVHQSLYKYLAAAPLSSKSSLTAPLDESSDTVPLWRRGWWVPMHHTAHPGHTYIHYAYHRFACWTQLLCHLQEALPSSFGDNTDADDTDAEDTDADDSNNNDYPHNNTYPYCQEKVARSC